MKPTYYNIRANKGVKPVKGYIIDETLTDRFGLPIRIGVHDCRKNDMQGDGWLLDDLETGYALNQVPLSTRQKAVERYFYYYRMKMRSLANAASDGDTLTNWYERKVAEFDEMQGVVK